MASQTLVQTAAVAKVNLLPPEIEERRQVRRVQVGLAGAVAAAVGVVAVLYVSQVGAVSDAQEGLDAERARSGRLVAEERTLQNVRDIYAAADAKAALVNRAISSKVLYSTFLTNMSLSMPDNVWLTDVTFTQNDALPQAPGRAPAAAAPATVVPVGLGKVTFTGVAFDHDDVAAWLESLSKQPGYANAYFTSSVESKIGTRTVYTFESSVVLTDAALASSKTARS